MVLEITNKKQGRFVDKERKNKTKPTTHWSGNKKVQQIATHLAEMGLTSDDMAYIFGIARWSIQEAKRRCPEFKEAVLVGKEKLHDILVAQMVLAATGYFYDEVRKKVNPQGKIIEKTITKKHVPANAQLMMFLMCNQWPDGTVRWPDGWKIKSEVMHKKETFSQEPGQLEADKISRLAGGLAKKIEADIKDAQ